MASSTAQLTGVERTFPESEIIVTKTDIKGRIVYANDIFLDITGFTEKKVLGQPHNFLRHPEMPRCIFKLLWDTIQGGEELFAYVINRTKSGDHYWVNAHVTPSLDSQGQVIGYHSNRRVSTKSALDVIKPLYKSLVTAETQSSDRKQGLAASFQMLLGILKDKGIRYDQFVLSL